MDKNDQIRDIYLSFNEMIRIRDWRSRLDRRLKLFSKLALFLTLIMLGYAFICY